MAFSGVMQLSPSDLHMGKDIVCHDEFKSTGKTPVKGQEDVRVLIVLVPPAGCSPWAGPVCENQNKMRNIQLICKLSVKL